MIWPSIQNDFNYSFQCNETLKYYILKFCLLSIWKLHSFNVNTIVFKKTLCTKHISKTFVWNFWCESFVWYSDIDGSICNMLCWNLEDLNVCLWANLYEIWEYVYKPTRCTKLLWIRLYFLLDALHILNYISPSSGANFINCTSHLVYAGTGIYQMRCTVYKICSWWWTNIVQNM